MSPLIGRTAEQQQAAREMLAPFVRKGYWLFPLDGKKPAREGWQTTTYTFPQIGGFMKRGFNVGIALGPDDLVLDADPRNGGDESFQHLCDDLGIDLFDAPTVLSGRGDGGCHRYFKRPAAMKLRGKLSDYPGVDVKTLGGFVVGPGSIHPDTGGVYQVDDFAPPISDVKSAPDALLQLLVRPDPIDSLGGERVGKFSNEQLAEFLAVIDPAAYGPGKHDEWFKLMASAHDATAGHGMVEWLAWCALDGRYGERDLELTARRWTSLTAGEPGGASYRVLLKAVVDAGYPERVAAFDGDDDVLEEDFLVYEMETDDE
ncbi:MAG: bifunctional DNA primase/polymerase [Planctomycetaceae bacterium]|nr:bifunctional DNA primase/polymerase [Planctomycetaceae bacterium]